MSENKNAKMSYAEMHAQRRREVEKKIVACIDDLANQAVEKIVSIIPGLAYNQNYFEVSLETVETIQNHLGDETMCNICITEEMKNQFEKIVREDGEGVELRFSYEDKQGSPTDRFGIWHFVRVYVTLPAN